MKTYQIIGPMVLDGAYLQGGIVTVADDFVPNASMQLVDPVVAAPVLVDTPLIAPKTSKDF